jgi:hypothetical protein
LESNRDEALKEYEILKRLDEDLARRFSALISADRPVKRP